MRLGEGGPQEVHVAQEVIHHVRVPPIQALRVAPADFFFKQTPQEVGGPCPLKLQSMFFSERGLKMLVLLLVVRSAYHKGPATWLCVCVFPESIAKGSSGKIASLVTQLNLHEPTCTSLTQPNLHEPTYTSQLAQPTYTSQLARANLLEPTCTANLHEPTCTSQLARANLPEPTCMSQLARANLHEPTCTRTTCTRYHTAKLARDIWTRKSLLSLLRRRGGTEPTLRK